MQLVSQSHNREILFADVGTFTFDPKFYGLPAGTHINYIGISGGGASASLQSDSPSAGTTGGLTSEDTLIGEYVTIPGGIAPSTSVGTSVGSTAKNGFSFSNLPTLYFGSGGQRIHKTVSYGATSSSTYSAAAGNPGKVKIGNFQLNSDESFNIIIGAGGTPHTGAFQAGNPGDPGMVLLWW